MDRLALPLLALILASCGRSNTAIVEQAFGAASRHDSAAFNRLVDPHATTTILEREPRALQLEHLIVSTPCRIDRFRSAAENRVDVEGTCELPGERADKPSAKLTWPLERNVYLANGRIIRVNIVIYPM